MTDRFTDLIPDARAFLRELAANNSRDWFKAHQPRYDAQLKAPALKLLDHVASTVARDDATELRTKLFRPQRDVRFSKDKSPYHIHLHMSWTLGSNGGAGTGLFFGIAPDYVRIGGGIMGFDKAQIDTWRSAMDRSEGERMEQMLQDLAARDLHCGEPELKRVPASYAKDHPRAGLLRRKSLTLWRDLDRQDWATPETALVQTYGLLTPLFGFLRETV